jgi:translation initiation factor eIF-2B subunit delta
MSWVSTTLRHSHEIVESSATAPSGDLLSSYPLTRPRETLILQDQPNLEILNPLYDLTPPTSITAVVTEVGVIPPSSISSIPFALGRQTL